MGFQPPLQKSLLTGPDQFTDRSISPMLLWSWGFKPCFFSSTGQKLLQVGSFQWCCLQGTEKVGDTLQTVNSQWNQAVVY